MSKSKHPKVAVYLSQQDWAIVADCVQDAATAPTVAAALASKVLRPIHEKILSGAQRNLPRYALAGAALAASKKKPTPAASLDASSWRAGCLRILNKSRTQDSQRAAVQMYRDITGATFKDAVEAVNELVEEIEERLHDERAA